MSEPTLRLTPLRPDALDDAQLLLYRGITEGARAGQPFATTDADGALLGPFDALLRTPELGQAVQQVGQSLRFAGVLPARLRELVILTVAAHWDSDYEWYAHSRVATGVGVSGADLDAVRAGDVPASCDDAEAAALRVAQALLRERRVSAEQYAGAVQFHTEGGVVELVCVVGYYVLLAGLLTTFDVGAPD